MFEPSQINRHPTPLKTGGAHAQIRLAVGAHANLTHLCIVNCPIAMCVDRLFALGFLIFQVGHSKANAGVRLARASTLQAHQHIISVSDTAIKVEGHHKTNTIFPVG